MDEFLDRAGPWAITLAQHNWPLVIYLPVILWVALRAYLRPSQRVLLLLYGFMILALAFEYHKNGTPVAADTISYLFSVERNPAMRRISQFVLLDAAPIAAHALGLALVLLSVALPGPRSLDHGAPVGPNSSRQAETAQQEGYGDATPNRTVA